MLSLMLMLFLSLLFLFLSLSSSSPSCFSSLSSFSPLLLLHTSDQMISGNTHVIRLAVALAGGGGGGDGGGVILWLVFPSPVLNLQMNN